MRGFGFNRLHRYATWGLTNAARMWQAAGFGFAAQLMHDFIYRQGAASYDQFASVIRGNDKYRQWETRFLSANLTATDGEWHAFADGRVDTIEFAGWDDFSPSAAYFLDDLTSGTDLTWALGTGRFFIEGFQYKLSEAVYAVDTRNSFTQKCCYDGETRGRPYQWDQFAFPKSFFREFFPHYRAGVFLAAQGWPEFYHTETIRQNAEVRCCRTTGSEVWGRWAIDIDRWECEFK